MIIIRREETQDAAAVREVNLLAFGQPQEADVVDELRANCPGLLSLVAIRDGRVVGHILFSPATIEGDGGVLAGMGLAPMSVLPEFQRQGIGSRLVRAGLAELKAGSCPFLIVLGHPEYYPRFGFERASVRGISSEWEVPDEAFMVLVLDDAAMQGVSGVARYRPEFAAAM